MLRYASAQLYFACYRGCRFLRSCAPVISSIGIDWEEFNSGGKLETQDGAVFLMNPEEIPPFTGELPDEIADKTGRTILLAQLTVNAGTTFTGHVNVQGRRPDGGSWQEHGVCFSIGKGCTKHPRVHDEV